MTRVTLVLAAFALVLAALAGTASAALRLGITDSGGAYFDDPATFYPLLERSGARLLRTQLNWGGVLGVAAKRPRDATDPADAAYDWSRYDAIVLESERRGV